MLGLNCLNTSWLLALEYFFVVFTLVTYDPQSCQNVLAHFALDRHFVFCIVGCDDDSLSLGACAFYTVDGDTLFAAHRFGRSTAFEAQMGASL